MNKIFKVVWSKVRNSYVVVSETAKANSKSGVRSIAAVAAVAAMLSGGIMSAEAAVTEVSDVKWDGSTYYYYTMQGTEDAVTASKTKNDGVLGGYYIADGQAVVGKLNSSVVVNGGDWNLVVGGDYVKSGKSNKDGINLDVQSTKVVVNDGHIHQIAGGTGGTDNWKLTYSGADSYAMTINGGSFGETTVAGNCPELLVTGGDLLKDGSGDNPDYNLGATSSVKNVNTTINDGTFNAAIIGGSSAIQYYGTTGSTLSKPCDQRIGLNTSVENVTTTINGGTFNHAIVAGGFAYGWHTNSTVENAVLNINGNTDKALTINGDIYAGALRGNVMHERFQTDGVNKLTTIATVGNAEVNISNAEVGNVYGTGAFIKQPGGNNTAWVYSQDADAIVDTDLTLDTVTAKTVDIAKGSITLKGDNTVETLQAGADTTVDVSGNADVGTLKVEQAKVNFNGDGTLEIGKSETKNMTYTADDGVTEATVVYNSVVHDETIKLTGVDLVINSKYTPASETEGAVRNASIESTGKVTINADGLCGVGAGPDKATMAQTVNSIKAKEIDITSTNAFGVYANDHSYHTVGTRVHSYLEAETINITSKKDGIYASNGAVTEVTGFKTLNVTSEEQGIGSEFGTMTFVGGDMTVTSAEEGIRSKLGGDLDIQVDKLKVDAGLESIKLTGDSILNVDAKTAQLDGDITLEDNNYGTPELDIAFEGAESYLNGNITTSAAGKTVIAFNNGAVWTTKDSGANSVTDLTVDGGTINQNSTDDITIGNYSGQGNVVFKDEAAGDVVVKTAASGAAMQLSMASVTADDIQSPGDLNDIANKLEADTTATGMTTKVYVAEGLLSSAINADVIYEDVDGDGLFNAHIKEVVQSDQPTTTVTAVSGIAANAAVAWRDEDATLGQRLGELRNSEGDQGVWARFTQGEFERGSDFETEYNMFQIGYDKAKGDWHYGIAVSHNEGDTVYSAGSGEFSSTSVSAYGTWQNDKGHYKDIVAKIGVIDNEYSVGAAGQLTKGDYDTMGTSISGEYGMKSDMGDGWYVTPLAKMTYMHIGSADYTTNNGINVKHKSVDSLIARLGVELGKELGSKGDVYVKASALHDFGGDADTVLRLGSNLSTITDEIGGTWYEVGIGFNYRTSDATYLYADVIKTYGDEIRMPWQWNVGVRYSF